MQGFEYSGRQFEMVMASDVVRDGIGLELIELDANEPGPVLEVFWHDEGPMVDFIVHRQTTLPLMVVEHFVEAARKSLPPSS